MVLEFKYLSKFLPIKTLDQMYKALVRSHLDYCDTRPLLILKINFTSQTLV